MNEIIEETIQEIDDYLANHRTENQIMTTFKPFQSIEQFRHFAKECKKQGVTRVELNGTVKIHGTNAGVTIFKDGTVQAQSRSTIITPEKDNYGFAAWVNKEEQFFRETFLVLLTEMNKESVTIYGEWFGKGVQKNVGVAGLEQKYFAVFAVKFEDEETIHNVEFYSNYIYEQSDSDLPNNFFFIDDFRTYHLAGELDELQDKIVAFTDAVEAECPVAQKFGISGIGEGIVWRSTLPNGQTFVFKVKGEKHSNTKIKTLVPVDLEEVREINRATDLVCTDARLEQGIELLKGELTMENIKSFLTWVVADVLKEESDLIEQMSVDKTKLMKSVTTKAVKYFKNKALTV